LILSGLHFIFPAQGRSDSLLECSSGLLSNCVTPSIIEELQVEALLDHPTSRTRSLSSLSRTDSTETVAQHASLSLQTCVANKGKLCPCSNCALSLVASEDIPRSPSPNQEASGQSSVQEICKNSEELPSRRLRSFSTATTVLDFDEAYYARKYPSHGTFTTLIGFETHRDGYTQANHCPTRTDSSESLQRSLSVLSSYSLSESAYFGSESSVSTVRPTQSVTSNGSTWSSVSRTESSQSLARTESSQSLVRTESSQSLARTESSQSLESCGKALTPTSSFVSSASTPQPTQSVTPNGSTWSSLAHTESSESFKRIAASYGHTLTPGSSFVLTGAPLQPAQSIISNISTWSNSLPLIPEDFETMPGLDCHVSSRNENGYESDEISMEEVIIPVPKMSVGAN
jgi:hypothetical protein